MLLDPPAVDASPVMWTLSWRGSTWRSTDLTGEHCAAVSEMLGVVPSWSMFDLSELNPVLGPLQTMALVAAFVCVADGVRGTAARRAVLDTLKGATADELAASISVP